MATFAADLLARLNALADRTPTVGWPPLTTPEFVAGANVDKVLAAAGRVSAQPLLRAFRDE